MVFFTLKVVLSRTWTDFEPSVTYSSRASGRYRMLCGALKPLTVRSRLPDFRSITLRVPLSSAASVVSNK
jgi:hypothetical protein